MDQSLESLIPTSSSGLDGSAQAVAGGGGGACGGGNFFALPHWYEYLQCTGTDGQITLDQTTGPQAPGPNHTMVATPDVFSAIPPVGLAVLDIALHIAGMVAIFFVIYGAIEYVVSQGEPDKVTKARGTIINALVGMTIAIFSIAVVKFLGARLAGGA